MPGVRCATRSVSTPSDGNDGALHVRDERHHAHHLRPAAPEFIRPRPAAAASITVDAADVARCSRELVVDARAACTTGAARGGIGKARVERRRSPAMPSTTLRPADRVGELLVVGRQRARAPRRRLGVQDRQLGGDRRGREAVGLGEEQVERRSRRACCSEMRVDELGHARARPRPLAVAASASSSITTITHRAARCARAGRAAGSRRRPRCAALRGRGENSEEERERGEEHQGEDAQAPQGVQRSISRPS